MHLKPIQGPMLTQHYNSEPSATLQPTAKRPHLVVNDQA